MERFEDFKRDEVDVERLTGMIDLPGIGVMTVDLDLEDHPEDDDLRDLKSRAVSWLGGFNKTVLDALTTAIAAELTDAAYAASAYSPVPADYSKLRRSLELTRICFFIDAETLLTFASQTAYPDMDICCLVDDSFTIVDLFVVKR